MQKTITISLDRARELYKTAGEDMKKLLLENFSKEELEKKEKAQFDGDLKNIRRAQIMCFIVAAWIAYVIVWGNK